MKKVLVVLLSILLLTNKSKASEDFELSVNIIRSVLRGLNLYEEVGDLDVCDTNTNTYFKYWEKSVNHFSAATDSYEIMDGIYAITDSMGQSSYMVRTCYSAQLHL